MTTAPWWGLIAQAVVATISLIALSSLMRSPARQDGFTLIEMMIVVVISAILVAGGLAAYRGIGKRENVKQAALTFQSNLRLFQSRALAGEKPAGCSGNLESFTVSNGSDLLSYQVQAICSATSANPVEYTFGSEVQLLSPLSSDIQFLTLRDGVVGSQTIVLTTSSGSPQFMVVVESSGVIRGDWQ